MTPFGARLRKLRAQRGLSLKDMAAGLGVSPAYLSALEHGRRGRPNRRTIHRICQYFQIIWDEAEELEALARISHPRVVVDSGGLSPKATQAANLLAQRIRSLDDQALDQILEVLEAQGRAAGAKASFTPPAPPSNGSLAG